MDGFSGVRDEGGRRIVNGAKDRKRGRRRGKRFGASPIILQSSATTHRLFLPPWLRGDVQIALMADQRGKLCPTGTYLFPELVCLSVPTLPSFVLHLSLSCRTLRFVRRQRSLIDGIVEGRGRGGNNVDRAILERYWSRFGGRELCLPLPSSLRREERKLFLRYGKKKERKKGRRKEKSPETRG